MALLEDLLFTRLSGFAGVSALVGSRIYGEDLLPQGVAYPAVNFFQVSFNPVHVMGADAGLVQTRYQFDCRAKRSSAKAASEAAREVAFQVRAAIQRWGSTGPPVVEDVYIENQREENEPDSDTYLVSIDARIHYQE